MEIKRIIIWGLRRKYNTFRYIYKAFYETAKKIGYEVLWLEDSKNNIKYIKPGDLILTADPVGKMVPEKFKFEDYNLPVRDDIYYCLHNVKDVFKNKLCKNNYINLEVYREGNFFSKNTEKWGPVTYFDKETKTLHQPWGTDLLANEFRKPVFNKNKFVFWVGSIWNDKQNHGNISEIAELKETLKKNKLYFIHARFVPNFINMLLVRLSRIAPAIAGKTQVEENYMPCRMFKNISYGQLGITNVKRFKDILGDSFIEGDSIEKIIENALSLSKEEYIKKTAAQQEIIKKYTYKESIENIFKAFNSK
jgi:hypothetical protein